MLQNVLTALLLPPLGLLPLAAFGIWLARRGHHRSGGLVVVAAVAALLLLATPQVAGTLVHALERDVVLTTAQGPPPAAIIILGADGARGLGGQEVGALTLERLRAGAALARRTGLPVLVTGGPGAAKNTPLATLMAASLASDFGIQPRWIEPRARDTHENAVFSVAQLRADGIAAAYVVTHAWHLPRAMEAFARLGFPVTAAPVLLHAPPNGRLSGWLPRPDYWGVSWYALREWAGRLVYALRDSR